MGKRALSNVLPAGVAFVSASQGCEVKGNSNSRDQRGRAKDGPQVTCEIQVGASKATRISIVVRPLAPGSLKNSATVFAPGHGSSNRKDEDSATTLVLSGSATPVPTVTQTPVATQDPPADEDAQTNENSDFDPD